MEIRMQFLRLNGKTKWTVEKIVLVAETLIISVILIYLCNNHGMDSDEAVAYRFGTELSPWGVVQAISHDIHPPLYYVLCNLLAHINDSIPFFKFMNTIPTILAMGMICMVVHKDFGFLTASSMIALFGMGPTFITFSSYMRMYSWLIFFLLWNLLAAHRILVKNRKADWIHLYISGVLGAYTHYFAVITLILFYLCLFFVMRKDTGKIKRWFCCVGASIAAGLPWAFVTLRQLNIKSTGGDVGFSDSRITQMLPWAFHTDYVGAVAACEILLVLSLILLLVKGQSLIQGTRNILYCSVIVAVLNYFVIVFFCSFSWQPFYERYAFASFLYIWFMMIVVLTTVVHRSTWSGAALLGFILMLDVSVFGLTQRENYFNEDEILQTMDFVEENMQPGDVVLYDYQAIDWVYICYMRQQSFTEIHDADWNELTGKRVWFAQMGGNFIPQEATDTFHITQEKVGDYALKGAVRFSLYKVEVGGAQ